jgi:hypothetical protein
MRALAISFIAFSCLHGADSATTSVALAPLTPGEKSAITAFFAAAKTDDATIAQLLATMETDQALRATVLNAIQVAQDAKKSSTAEQDKWAAVWKKDTEALATDDDPANAAPDWTKAIALAPGDADPIWKLADCARPTSPDATAATIADACFAHSIAAFAALVPGSRKAYCEWSLLHDARQSTSPPFTDRLLRLIHLLTLHARWQALHGDGPAAVDDLLLAVRVATLGSRHPFMVDVLNGQEYERPVMDAAGWVLPRLAPADRRRLATGWTTRSASADIATALDREQDNAMKGVAALRTLPKAERLHSGLIALLWSLEQPTAQPDAEPRPIDPAWAEMHCSDATLDDFLTNYPAEVARWKAWFLQPQAARLQPLSPHFTTGDTAINPMMNSLGVPFLDQYNASAIAIQLRRQMLTAAIDDLDSGAPGLATHPDPITGKPFTITILKQGFVLSTNIPHHVKPTRLVIGEASASEVVDPPEPPPPPPPDF